MGRQQLAFAGLHLDPFGILGVIHSEKMQDPMHDQQRDLIVEGTGMGGRVSLRHERTDHDITEQQRKILGIVLDAIRARTAFIGPTTGSIGFTIDREREHIGRSVGFHEPLVEIADRLLINEHHGEFSLTLDALIGQHREREDLPSIHGDRDGILFIGDEDGHRTIGGTAPLRATPTWRLVQDGDAFSYALTMSCTMR